MQAPGFGDCRKAKLQDIAILTRGQAISDEVGLSLTTVDGVNGGFSAVLPPGTLPLFSVDFALAGLAARRRASRNAMPSKRK